MVHVPYRGGAPALTDLIGGQVQVYFSYLPESIESRQSRQGARARGDDRNALAGLPDLPTVGDFVPGFEASSWQGIGAPRNTPADIVARLNKRGQRRRWPIPKHQGAACRSSAAPPRRCRPAIFEKFIVAMRPRSGPR